MNKKKIVRKNTERHFGNPDIYIQYELEFKNDVIKPGDKFIENGMKFRKLKDGYFMSESDWSCDKYYNNNQEVEPVS